MSNQDLYENIEAYLMGELSGAELVDFETQLKSNPDLAQRVLLFKEMDTALVDRPALDFQQIIQEEGKAFLAEETKPASVKPIGWSRRLMGMAAAIIILVGAVMIWKNQSTTPASGPELFAQYFDTYNIKQEVRGNIAIDQPRILINAAIEKYKSGDFSMAATAFQYIANSDVQNMEVAFYLSNALLNLKSPDFPEAELQLQKIIDDGNSIYVPKSQWYLALIYLQKGEMEKAKTTLLVVAQSNDRFGIKAQEILQRMNN